MGSQAFERPCVPAAFLPLPAAPVWVIDKVNLSPPLGNLPWSTPPRRTEVSSAPLYPRPGCQRVYNPILTTSAQVTSLPLDCL